MSEETNDQYWARVKKLLAEMPETQRTEILVRAYYSVCPRGERWEVMGDNGGVGTFDTKREAEDSIIEGTGMFDISAPS